MLIEKALEGIGFGKFQWLLLFLCGTGYAAGTIELILVTLLIPKIKDEIMNQNFPLDFNWPLDQLQTLLGWLPTLSFIGSFIGSLIWGFLADYFGRKFCFWSSALATSIIGILSLFSPSFLWLLISRFFLGIALGGNLSLDFVFFIEFLPKQSRAFYASLLILFGITGILYTSLAGYFTMETWGWRWFLFFCILPNIILFFLRLFWKWESPRYLLSKGKKEEALEVLKVMANWNGKSIDVNSLIVLNNQQGDKKSFWQQFLVFKQDLKLFMILILMFCIWFYITFGYYGVTIWLQEFTKTKSPYLIFLYMGISEIPGLFFTILLLHLFGRKKSLALLMFLSAAFLMLVTMFDTELGQILSLCLFYFSIVGCWTVVYIFTPEVFPTPLRNISFALTNTGATLAGMLSGPLGGLLLDHHLPIFWILLVFSCAFLVGSICSLLLPIDTHLKDLEDEIVLYMGSPNEQSPLLTNRSPPPNSPLYKPIEA